MKALNKVKALLDDLHRCTKILILNVLVNPKTNDNAFFTPASSFINTLTHPAFFHESHEMIGYALSYISALLGMLCQR